MKMKQKLTLLFAFVLAMTQGFAMPLDSLMTFVPCDKGSVLTIEKNEDLYCTTDDGVYPWMNQKNRIPVYHVKKK